MRCMSSSSACPGTDVWEAANNLFFFHPLVFGRFQGFFFQENSTEKASQASEQGPAVW